MIATADSTGHCTHGFISASVTTYIRNKKADH